MNVFLLFVLLLISSSISSPLFAGTTWHYLVDKDNNVFAKQNGGTTEKQQVPGNFIDVASEKNIDLSVAEYRGGKIVEHVKTAKEIKYSQDAIAYAETRKMRKQSAKDKLTALGLTTEEVDALSGNN